MLLPRLGTISSCLCRINRPVYLLSQKNYAKEITNELKNKEDDDSSKPIPLSTSPAAQWQAKWNREPPEQVRHYVWYTPYVIYLSMVVFMVYFCVLREENDLDDIIYRPLPRTIQGIEKLYPEIDFETKPAFVAYYDKLKEDKLAKKNNEIR